MIKHNFLLKVLTFHTNSKTINVAVFLPPILDQDINYQKEKPKCVTNMLGCLSIVAQTTNISKNFQPKPHLR